MYLIFKKFMLSFILISLVSGCATILTKTNQDQGHVYSGFVCNIKGLSMILEPPLSLSVLLLPVFVIDLPLSLVADTFFLPADLNKPSSRFNYQCKMLEWLE